MALNDDPFQIGLTVYRFMASFSTHSLFSQKGSNILLPDHLQVMVTP